MIEILLLVPLSNVELAVDVKSLYNFFPLLARLMQRWRDKRNSFVFTWQLEHHIERLSEKAYFFIIIIRDGKIIRRDLLASLGVVCL